ncbi:GNAT family N-acetyltransferase [Microbaculum marinisediminis]|uniref:N-acetyltransferase n=1 Tax=Microbaculum marinisediminis TaxID=2931392 RepID=A0AAW5QRV5_9HYPH|nr:N-acetyltransferase [Microbaculum sp. A6E488]MCT8970821.1 N-acetyltransferase [Microbaculum sp. A6E488]
MSSDKNVDGVTIRQEAPADVSAIRCVISAAFDSELEAKLIDKLRKDGDLVLSLVAEKDGKIVGYAGFSRLRIEGSDNRATALAPVAVARCYQRRGVGTALVRDGIGRLEEAGEDLVFVLGDPPYYKRFGFDSRIASHYCAQWSGPAFMALALEPGGQATHRPQVVYPAAFEAFG